jgi:hypothetical protein
MAHDLIIYLDRLKSGKVQKFDDHIDQDFLHSENDWLTFLSKVYITGRAYLADDYLILNLTLAVDYLMPCKICNVEETQSLIIPEFYHSLSCENLKSAQYCPLEVIRETILADIPTVFECNGGNCKERASLKQYLKNGEDHGSTKK